MWKTFSTYPHPRICRSELADAGKWLLKKDLLVDLIGIEPMTSSMPFGVNPRRTYAEWFSLPRPSQGERKMLWLEAGDPCSLKGAFG